MKRIRQGLRALFSFALPLDIEAAEAHLSPALMALFKRMTRSEQLHAIRVMRTLEARGHDEADVLTAALLHDVGKSRYGMNLFGRTTAALVLKFSHRTYLHYLNATHLPPRGWQRPFVIAAQHPAWSADDMAAAGASERAVWLAAHHADEPQVGEDRLLTALREADEAN